MYEKWKAARIRKAGGGPYLGSVRQFEIRRTKGSKLN